MGIEFYTALVSIFVIGLIAGGMAVFFVRRIVINRQLRTAQRRAAKTVAEARLESKEVLREAKEEADKTKSLAEAEYRERRSELQRQESRLSSKSETLDRKLEGVEQRERNLVNKEKEVESIRANLGEVRDRQLKQLELISGMSSNEAKQALLDNMEIEMQGEASRRLREWENELKEEADRKAHGVLAQVIQRSASEITTETTVSTIPIPSDV